MMKAETGVLYLQSQGMPKFDGKALEARRGKEGFLYIMAQKHLDCGLIVSRNVK